MKYFIVLFILLISSCTKQQSPTEDDLVKYLNLTPHPDGGYYHEAYRSTEKTVNCPVQLICNDKNRPYATSIYSLVKKNNTSPIHRIKSDEILHFYAGDALEIAEITQKGSIKITILGNDITKKQKYMYVIPAKNWFRTRTLGEYSLFGSTVSPGFEFSDFEIADTHKLTE
jgi:hypothetical protein